MGARLEKISEQVLAELLASKSEKSFSILYDNYSSAIFGVVNKIVQSEAIAADITQDSFVKIWKNLDSYSSTKGTIFTWMLNIARNTAIDKIRSQHLKQTKQNVDVDSYVGEIDGANSGSINIDTIGLKNLIEKLKPEYKQLIDLVYFRGYSQSEIADEFGIPLGTIKTRIKTAMTNLRTFMAVILIIILIQFLK